MWRKLGTREKRDLNTIFLPGKVLEDIISDCKLFLESRDNYRRIGIPYRRGYLLYGAPGCGKSSLLCVEALARARHLRALKSHTPSPPFFPPLCAHIHSPTLPLSLSKTPLNASLQHGSGLPPGPAYLLSGPHRR